jgi:chromosome segregation protein
LKTLRNQPGPPLLIDQPEKDPDNPVARDRRAAVDREAETSDYPREPQCHLVVNGDAELVAWCDHRKTGRSSGGKNAGEGAIDVPEVPGEAGFNLRWEQYGL